ncbi:unnamed protein product [Closterium sp. NIES-64]|nr:unnamed protein product [Closterium sp. NIES-64]CAI5968563.1 unnamed protein product [Closterium sp. NIES-65]CAI5997496.1 unnamed protein product [Closterium sp. NIES-65]
MRAAPTPPAGGAASIDLAFPFQPSSSAPQFEPDTLPDLPASSQPTIPPVPNPATVPSAPSGSPAAPTDSPRPPSPEPSTSRAPVKPGVPDSNTSARPSPKGTAPAVVTPGAACPASDLDGYTFSAPLIPDQFVLHWRLRASALDIAVEARLSSQIDNGWMGVGWSLNGAMSPSDAVIGNLEGGAIRSFSLGGYTADSVNATSHINLGDKGSTSTASGSTVFWFSRSPGDGGLVPIQLSGPNFLIWAYSRDMFQTLGYHSTHRGVSQVDFSCNTAPQVLLGEGSPEDDDQGEFTLDNPYDLSLSDPLGEDGNDESTGSSNGSGYSSTGAVPRGDQPGGVLRKVWNVLFPSFG